MERWVQTCRRELLDRTLIWNQSYLLHSLRECEHFYNRHGHTRASRTPARSSCYPRRSWPLTRSPVFTYDDAIDSAACSMSTSMRHELRG